MKVSFELSKRDLRFFRERLKQVRGSGKSLDEAVVIHGAESMVEEAIESEPPDFVLQRIGTLEKLVEMLRDEDWRLEGRDRARIIDALAYFVDPDDLIHDKIPGIGYIDDAIMVELVSIELKHEIAAYDDFCSYREAQPTKEDLKKLETRRAALHQRMRRRRRRERSTKRTRGASAGSRLRLW
jgi:uncharacterized membrane protein YkvA (DUF1232 family)